MAPADTSSYTGEPVHINTGQTHDRIYYRILLSGISDNTETIVDTLPAGMAIVKNSVYLAGAISWVTTTPAYGSARPRIRW